MLPQEIFWRSFILVLARMSVRQLVEAIILEHRTTPSKATLAYESDSSKKLMIQVKGLELELLSKQPNLQLSVAQHIAALFELQPRTDVIVRKARIV